MSAVNSGNSHSGGDGSGAEECDGEEQEDPSSLSMDLHNDSQELFSYEHKEDENDEKSNVEDALYSFRQQWQRELESPVKQSTANKAAVKQPLQDAAHAVVDSEEERAKKFFLKGVEHEQNGKLYESIQFYKRAVQLIPDIEFRLYESSKKSKGRDESPLPTRFINDLNEDNEDDDSSDDEFEDMNLMSKIEKIVSKDGSVCRAEYEQRSAHISSLPTELVLYIFRWVVSSELDVLSLERCAEVCRGFYLCARDQEIWRLACVKTWGINCGTPKAGGFGSWRSMFIERPRLRFNGCYISKTTYLRHGDNSYQDQFYRPWYLIEYYRYLRLFPDGIVLMLTTADEPSQCCSFLKQRLSRAQGVLSGHYRLHGDKVIIVVKKPAQPNQNKLQAKRKDNVQESNSGQTYHLELQIQSQKSRRFCSLHWIGYTIFTKNSNGTESSNSFDIVKTKFPPFWFSRVKSYHAEADSPLQ